MGDMLSFASYTIVKKFGDNNREINGLWFNKVISLLNVELDKNGKNMKLPHYWYFWGDMVSIRDMPNDLILIDKDSNGIADGTKNKFRWDGKKPTGVTADEKRKIKSIVDSIHAKYPQTKKGTKKLLTDVYAYAPYDFQRDYAKFRTDAYDFDQTDPQLNNLKSHLLDNDFQAAMKTFPHNEFSDMIVQATTVRIIGEALLSKKNSECNAYAEKLMKEFWEAFCKRMRISDGSYFNIKPRNFNKLLEESIEDLKEYEHNLQLFAIKILNECPMPEILDDPAIQSFVIPDDWGEGTEDTSERIDDILYS